MTNPLPVLSSTSNPYAQGFESVNIEKEKTEFLKKTKAELKQFIKSIINYHTTVLDEHEIENISKYKLWAKKALYYFLIFYGLIEDLCGNYIFSASIFSLIPNLADPYLMGFSIVYTLLNAVLFYGFGASYLKEGLGLINIENNSKSYIEEYTQQLKLTKSINKLLCNLYFTQMDSKQYTQYIALAKAFNEDLNNKKIQLMAQPEHETSFRKALRRAVVSFGIISRAIGSYFMANTILTALCAPLVGTPVGWALIFLSIASGLGFYYAMEIQSMKNLVSPLREKFMQLKHMAAKFNPQDADAFERLLRSMHPNVTIDLQLTLGYTQDEQEIILKSLDAKEEAYIVQTKVQTSTIDNVNHHMFFEKKQGGMTLTPNENKLKTEQNQPQLNPQAKHTLTFCKVM